MKAPPAASVVTGLDRKLDDASRKAHSTGTWAKTMTQVLLSRAGGLPKWRVINFVGPGGAESRGIVDLLAIRKDHRQPAEPGLKRGDLFDIVLIQVKGGSAPMPTAEDRERLRQVAQIYRAKHVLLSEWKRGAQARFAELVGDEWVAVEASTIFGGAKGKPGGGDALPSTPSPRAIAAQKAWATRRERAKAGGPAQSTP